MNNFIRFVLSISFLGLIIGCSASKEELLIIQKQNQVKSKQIEQKRKLKLKQQAATVIALGYGNTKEQALKNAFSTAVGEYVGVLVDAKEVTKNGKLIEDKILTFSNGYIDRYTQLSSKEQMGLWEVKISAVIKQQKISSQIKKLKIKAIDIKDSENRYAKLVSQVKTKFDAEEIFIKLSKELMSIQTFRKYVNLEITGIDINIDEATRKYVPVYIKHKVLFNWNEYDKITKKIENIYKQLGGEIVYRGVVSLNTMTKSIYASYRKYGYEKNKFTSIFIYVRENNNLNLHVWKFPKSYGVIYPFQDKIYSNYWEWTKYAQDEKRLYIPNEAYGYQKYIISFLDKRKNIIFTKKDLKINDKQGWVYGGYYEIISSTGEHRRIILPSRTSSIKNRHYNTKDNLVYFDGVVEVKVPVKYIEQLKQIKITWQDK